MTQTPIDIAARVGPDLPPKTDYRIGCIGAGFIMKDIHLVAYEEAGFDVVAIASRTPTNARAASRNKIWRSRCAMAGLKMKAGVCGKTARAFGPTW